MEAIFGNPLLPSWEYIPDGEPHLFGKRLYLIGSHDRFGGTDFCQNDYVVWSTPVDDLSAWECHGISYRRTQDPFNGDGTAALYAPDAAQGADGRFYLYYCLANHPRIGVAVADDPAGPYEFVGHVRDSRGQILGTRSADTEPFDPGVLVDGDRVWLYYGSGPHPGLPGSMERQLGAVVVALEADMITIKSEPQATLPTLGNAAGTPFEGHEFFEASSPRRYGDDYYLVYSSVQGHELCWARASGPEGPWQYGGVLISNADLGVATEPTLRAYAGNNHGGLVQLPGGYAVFYHRHTNRTQYSRQACAEPIERDEDGNWLQARLSSSGIRFGSLPGGGVFPAAMACHLQSANGADWSEPRAQRDEHPALTQEATDSEPIAYVENMRNGASVGFRSFALTGPTSVGLVVRGAGTGALEVCQEANGPAMATAAVYPSDEWNTVTAEIDLKATSPIYLRFIGAGSIDIREMALNPTS